MCIRDRIRDLHIYERTIPIVYNFDLPETSDLQSVQQLISEIRGCSNLDNEVRKCTQAKVFINDVIDLIQDLEAVRRAIEDEFRISQPGRVKRGLQFIGDFERWCCNVLTLREGEVLSGNELSLREGYSHLRSSVLADHASLLNFTEEQVRFSSNVASKIGSLETAMREVVQSLNVVERDQSNLVSAMLAAQLVYNNLVSQTAKLQFIFSSCRGHYLPTCLLYTSPSPRDRTRSRMPSSA